VTDKWDQEGFEIKKGLNWAWNSAEAASGCA